MGSGIPAGSSRTSGLPTNRRFQFSAQRPRSPAVCVPELCVLDAASPTCVRAQVAFKCSMARESPVAFAADVAANAGVDLHVLLQRSLGLETLPAEQTEDGHVGACGARTQRHLTRTSIPSVPSLPEPESGLGCAQSGCSAATRESSRRRPSQGAARLQLQCLSGAIKISNATLQSTLGSTEHFSPAEIKSARLRGALAHEITER